MIKKKGNQANIHKHISKRSDTRRTSADPSGGIREESTVTIRHDISVLVIAPEDLPVGQKWRCKTL